MDNTGLFDLLKTIELSHWAPWAILILMMLESMPVTGLLLPGIVIMLGLGSLSSTAFLDLPQLILLAAMGAILGDSIGYWLGYRGLAHWLPKPRQALRTKNHQKILDLVNHHGAIAAFWGRFLWFVHPLVPVIVGTSRIPPWRFYLADIPAVFIWVSFYASLGHWGTRFAIERSYEFLVTISLLAFAVAMFLIIRSMQGKT